jgi:hypothetical protein
LPAISQSSLRVDGAFVVLRAALVSPAAPLTVWVALKMFATLARTEVASSVSSCERTDPAARLPEA